MKLKEIDIFSFIFIVSIQIGSTHLFSILIDQSSQDICFRWHHQSRTGTSIFPQLCKDFAAREVLSFWETPAQQMRGTVDTWFRDTVTRLSSAGLQNSELICEHLLERVSFISFRSFLKGRLVLAKSDIEWLLEKSSEECEINSVDFLNFFFVFNDRGSGEIQFHNEPQQKVLSAFYVSQQMKKSKKLAEIVSITNEKEHQISSSENMRSSDIICMMWVQSCKSFFYS